MNITISGFNISTSETVPASQAVDGCPILYGPATITAHNADWVQVNQRGYSEEIGGAELPIVLNPGDVLLLGRRATEADNRSQYFPASGRSANSKIVAVACVPATHPNTQLMRVMGIGGGQTIRLLRSYPITAAQIDLTKLPSVVVLPPAVASAMLHRLERIFSGFCGEIHSQWATDQRTPDLQHPGYGSYLASCVSQALVVLCSTLPMEQKRRLATLLVQWGLDLAGAFLDGRVNQSNGGHMQGRKALVILAGYLLGIPQMANPDAFTRLWQETCGYFSSAGAWWNGWQHGWNCYGDGDGEFLSRHPSTWTNQDGPNGERSQVYRMQGYFSHVMGCQVGTALAMKLMGLEQQMGASFVGCVAQWMEGPSATANAALRAVGVDLPWGTDYDVLGWPGTCAQAWRANVPA